MKVIDETPIDELIKEVKNQKDHQIQKSAEFTLLASPKSKRSQTMISPTSKKTLLASPGSKKSLQASPGSKKSLLPSPTSRKSLLISPTSKKGLSL